MKGGEKELSSIVYGGRGLGESNKHYGVPSNMLRTNRGVDLGDGWETARCLSRPAIITTDENTGLVDLTARDWCVLRLACAVTDITKLVVETTHFKGNYSESVQVDYCNVSDRSIDCSADGVDRIDWQPLQSRTRLGPDETFVFDKDHKDINVPASSEVTHLRVCMYPDGGISRARLFGTAARPIEDSVVSSV